jgi:hypothetical protein
MFKRFAQKTLTDAVKRKVGERNKFEDNSVERLGLDPKGVPLRRRALKDL